MQNYSYIILIFVKSQPGKKIRSQSTVRIVLFWIGVSFLLSGNVYCTHINTTELNYRLRRKKTECHTFVKICHFSMEHPSILWTLFGWLAHRVKPATWYQYTFSESSLTIANNGGLFIIQTILCCSHFNQ